MSEQNVELVRQGYAHFNVHREPDYELLDPDVEWHTAEDLPDSTTYVGPERVAQLFSDWNASFDDFSADVHELRDTGDRVIASVTLRGRVKNTGAQVSLPEIHVWTIRDGRTVEILEYRTIEQALEALGLEAEAD